MKNKLIILLVFLALSLRAELLTVTVGTQSTTNGTDWVDGTSLTIPHDTTNGPVRFWAATNAVPFGDLDHGFQPLSVEVWTGTNLVEVTNLVETVTLFAPAGQAYRPVVYISR